MDGGGGDRIGDAPDRALAVEVADLVKRYPKAPVD
jgi:hypothetical protein